MHSPGLHCPVLSLKETKTTPEFVHGRRKDTPTLKLSQVLRNGIIVNWESGKSHMTISGLHGTWPKHSLRQNGKRAMLAHTYRKNQPTPKNIVSTFETGESLRIRFTMAQMALPRIK
jgi:hypothetical protein